MPSNVGSGPARLSARPAQDDPAYKRRSGQPWSDKGIEAATFVGEGQHADQSSALR